MKKYEKPVISVLTFSQKEHVAADCRFCYAGYETGSCSSQTVCWGGAGSCVPDDAPAYNG